MTAQEIREQVEAAKREAAINFDRNHGAGAYARMAVYSASPANRRALDRIADVANGRAS